MAASASMHTAQQNDQMQPQTWSPSSPSTTAPPPLSWSEARQILRRCLEEYVDESTNQYRRLRHRGGRRRQHRQQQDDGHDDDGDDDDNDDAHDSTNLSPVNETRDGTERNDWMVKDRRQNHFFKSWFRWDLDIWVGCFGSSVVLLVIGILSMTAVSDSSGSSHGSTVESSSSSSSSSSYFRAFAQSQMAGSILIFVGCTMNIWSINRYRFSASQGTDGLKRRMIMRFLRTINVEEEHSSHRMSSSNSDGSGSSTTNNGIELAGTSLTDIYPVYRRSSSSSDDGKEHRNGGGSWSRIPTLLLVQGDRIALQVGDAAPCKCRVVSDGRGPSSVFEMGDKITIAKCSGENVQKMISNLPRGRTTFQAESDNLLRLCNDMRIFEVTQTPIISFLREKEKDCKSPQLLRQLETVRSVLSKCGAVLFLLSFIVLLGRQWNNLSLSSATNESQFYFLLPTPFLVLISCFAFTGPMYLIFIESLGTSRILASYHPVSSRGQTKRSGETETPNVDVLILRYFLSIVSNRYALQDLGRTLDYWLLKSHFFGSQRRAGGTSLVSVPPASLYLLEKLGVATALTLVDDELVCEPQAVPQQLLIPSGKGLKLLDLCPTYEDDTDDDDDGDDVSSSVEFRRARQRSFDAEMHYDSDSDSDEGQMKDHHHVPRRRKPRRRLVRKAFRVSSQKKDEDDDGDSIDDDDEVQFEDPTWWQQLPSLKCIGLGCLLVDPKNEIRTVGGVTGSENGGFRNQEQGATELGQCKKSLVGLVSKERRSQQLRVLASCIGFSTKPNYTGNRGDISPFIEKLRMHVVSASMVSDRMEIDTHERSSEDSRWWGLLRADATSCIVQDNRSGAYQLLTVGDPKVVTRMCHEAWQGENSTILPLASQNRATILETSDNWKLADLDVEAFSYAPIPHTFEARLAGLSNSKVYLLDNDLRRNPLMPYQKDKGASAEWNLLNNQIFLGILGSLVIPRDETQGLLSTLQDAGVRFVYFSPRNMRRQKEIASQMGIDVAWNCAISLRPLDKGEEDTHRMVSDYADWDVNAKLPHGIESVRRHLVDVDNVPLLVSLFTDVTKTSTMEMIDIFQEYHDTVIAVGLSHLPRNSKIFSSADLAVGVDVLTECIRGVDVNDLDYNAILPSEVVFATQISAHNCAFRLSCVSSMENLPTILAQGRASFSASVSASIYMLSCFLSFAFFCLFNLFSVSVSIPYIPSTGAFLFLQIVIPLIAIPMAMSDSDRYCMQQVPPKNDKSISFAKKEHNVFFFAVMLKSIIPAILPQLLYLIAFGEFMIAYENEVLQTSCPYPQTHQPGQWMKVIRCSGLSGYTGSARDMASVLSLAELMLCVILASMSFVYRVLPVWEEPPWQRNHLWCVSVALGVLVVTVYLLMSLDDGALSALPWYFFFLAFFIMPLLCIVFDEILKRPERRVLDRAEKLRRLQFETRLGMWSPK